jgi:hypothetical protein
MKKTVSLQYLGGLFDGEGSINITPKCANDARRGHLYLQISLGNTNRKACEMLAKMFGGNVYLQRKAGPKNKAFWVWLRTWGQAALVLRALLPHLELKRREARIGLRFEDHVARQGRGRYLTPESTAFRLRCRERLIEIHGLGARAKNRLAIRDASAARTLAKREKLQIHQDPDVTDNHTLVGGLNERIH